MKYLLMFLFVLGFAACSSSQLNDAKKAVVEKVHSGVKSNLEKSFSGYSDLSCEEESEKLAGKVSGEIYKILKIQEESQVSKSLGGEVLKLACKGLLVQALPMVLPAIGNLSEYPCSMRFVVSSGGSLSDKLCDGINL